MVHEAWTYLRTVLDEEDHELLDELLESTERDIPLDPQAVRNVLDLLVKLTGV